MVPRGKVQEESMYYGVFDQGHEKHYGSLRLIGVNTFMLKIMLGGSPSRLS
ncbi:hypothetical protein [Rhodanobacter terrae]|uniref:Uncharacterized protein n=1 Tax=Rhodanobacter terrae TaxID=418647 RepID=A0ABW0T483_9GAMM